jgi:prepilin-type N-terminal cleavage/methylation domain-containing protein/prepilin-type processing-associated H-X9-DG protein
MSDRMTRKAGFTLTELVVVIAVALVLVGISIPALAKARSHGRLVTCANNLRQIHAAFNLRTSGPAPLVRLPDAGEWQGLVAGSAQAADRLLWCPDGTAAEAADGPSGIVFNTWHGNGQGNPNSSRLHGQAPWRPYFEHISDDRWIEVRFYMPNRPEIRLVVEHTRLSGESWQAVVLEEPETFRTDAILLSDGKRMTNIAAGAAIEYSATRPTDYGYNLMASNLTDPRMPRVLVMDYTQSIIDFDGLPLAANDDDSISRIPRDRHLGRINALMSDGSVQSFDGPAIDRHSDELHPRSRMYAIANSRGPEPGAASDYVLAAGAPASGGSDAGGGDGVGNGKDNGNGSGKGNGSGSGNGEDNGTGGGKGKGKPR